MQNKILYLTGCILDESSGPYHSVKQTVEYLNNQGDHVAVMATIPRAGTTLEREWAVPIFKFKRYGPDSMHITPTFKKWLNVNSNWDLISIQGVWFYFSRAASEWCIKNNIPYIITIHGNLNSKALEISSLKKKIASKVFVNKVLKNAACLHALNFNEYTILRELGYTQPICVVGNGIAEPRLGSISVQHHIPEKYLSKRTCLYLGRLHPIKGVDRLLHAWSKMTDSSAWQLVIAGDGDPDYVQKLKVLVKKLNLKNVYFIGFVNGEVKSAWLKRAELFVLTSFSEAFPMSILEALSHRTAVLMTNVCGLNSAVAKGAALEVTDDNNSIEIGLREMLSLPQETLQSMGEVGVQFVRDNYSWGTVGKQLKEVNEWLINDGVKPDCVYLD